MLLSNEIALITGASRGIGLAIAIELGRQGAIIVGTSTSDKGVETINKAMKENNITGCGYVLNVNDQASIDMTLKALSERYGAPTILINNAGVTRDNLLMRMKDDEWADIIETNLSSVYRLTKACVRGMMQARHGRIISISSVVGVMGNAGQTNYAAAKAGIIGFTKSLAREIGSRGITVNAVAPGFIDTDMTRALSDQHKNALLEKIPLNRLGQMEEVAAAVAFLASPSASYITGETLHVNGGMFMS
ncbi:MAG: 3-oxoacyl-ACP reductase FabG [Gammaproteobacteria bacterium]